MARVLQAADILSFRVWSADVSSETQACVTTFDFRIDPGTFVSGMTDQQAVVDYDGLIAATFKGILSDSVRYNGCQLTYRNVVPLPATVFNNSNAGNGTAGAGLAPTQVRGQVKRLTAFAGRKFRGRIFAPFVSAADVGTTGLPQGAYITALQAMIAVAAPLTGQTLVVGADTVKLIPVLWNRASRSSTDITAYQYPNFFATQRKSGSLGRPNTSPIYN